VELRGLSRNLLGPLLVVACLFASHDALAVTGNPWRSLNRFKTKKLTTFASRHAVEVFREQAKAAADAWPKLAERRHLRFYDQYRLASSSFHLPSSDCGSRSLVTSGDFAYALHGSSLTTIGLLEQPRVVGHVALHDPNAQDPPLYDWNLWVDGSLVVVAGYAHESVAGDSVVFSVFNNDHGQLTLLRRFRASNGTFASGKLVLSDTRPPLDAAPARRSYRPLRETMGAVLHRFSVCDPATGMCDITEIAAGPVVTPAVLGDAVYVWAEPWVLTGDKPRLRTLYRVPLDGSAVSALFVRGGLSTWSLDSGGRLNVAVQNGRNLHLLQLPRDFWTAIANQPVRTLSAAELVQHSRPLAPLYRPNYLFNAGFSGGYLFYGSGQNPYLGPNGETPPDGDVVDTLFAQNVTGGPTRALLLQRSNNLHFPTDFSPDLYRLWPWGDNLLVQRGSFFQLLRPAQLPSAGSFGYVPHLGHVCSVAFTNTEAGAVIGLAHRQIDGRAGALFVRRRDRQLQALGQLEVSTAPHLSINVRLLFRGDRALLLAGDVLVEAALLGNGVRELSRLYLPATQHLQIGASRF